MTFNQFPPPPYLLNAHFDDRYFDIVDAIAEAKYIYLDGCEIWQNLTQKQSCIIGELGFGAGRVLLALLDELERRAFSNCQIDYYSVELHPLSPERLAQILDSFAQQVNPHWIHQLIGAYSQLDLTQSGWQVVSISGVFGQLHLHLWLGEALDMVQALDVACDAWFLEGHGPKKNPSIWRSELLQALGPKTRTGGYCATFSVAVQVRKDLAIAGFETWKREGMGRKNFVLQGRKR